VTGPDTTNALWPSRLISRHPPLGIPGTPPWRASHWAARTGVGCPPRSDTRESANPDPPAHAVAAADAGVVPAAGLCSMPPDGEPHAPAAITAASVQPPITAPPSLMLLGRNSAADGSAAQDSYCAMSVTGNQYGGPAFGRFAGRRAGSRTCGPRRRSPMRRPGPRLCRPTWMHWPGIVPESGRHRAVLARPRRLAGLQD
jgi:hypothetical protein